MKLFKKNNYFASVDNVGVFENNSSSMLPQTVCAKRIRAHFQNAQKTPKALIMGFDGARADCMGCLVKATDKTLSGELFYSTYSAVNTLKKEGGLYLSYAGGEPSARQHTSTAQGWASILTGEWGGVNGVLEHVPLRPSCPTVLRELAEKGKSAAFLAEWDDHFTITYKEEIAISQSQNLPLTFTQYKDDETLAAGMAAQIAQGTDCIFGIFEAPDSNGHGFGFNKQTFQYVTGLCNLDRTAYMLMERVKARPTYAQEDWLILITSDHGGHGRGHGTQKDEDRATFIACNKPVTV